MRDQNTKDKYQQRINLWNSGQANGKVKTKHPTKNGWKKNKVWKRKSEKWKNYRSVNHWERSLRRAKTGEHVEQTRYQISGGKHWDQSGEN